MDKQNSEITEIPEKAITYWENTAAFKLPFYVPYLGMGSSYFAPLAFKFMGIEIYPEMASEYFIYQASAQKLPLAVILSQSGKSTEALWCTELFTRFIAVSNDTKSTLCTSPNASLIVNLMAGDEQYSSSKTYINTLLVLFKGFGFDAKPAIDLLKRRLTQYEVIGQQMAEEVHGLITTTQIHGIYIIGSGPNIATAMQAALILSESTKRNFTGMPMAQYDHGPKETACNSIVIQVLARGKSYDRSNRLSASLQAAGAHVFTVEEPGAAEHESILHNIIPFNFMAYYLSKKRHIEDTFTVGGKITEVIL